MAAHEIEQEEYENYERWLHSYAFTREETRRTILKRQCTPGCGHWIDGGEPYRYQVWKLNMDSEISQRRDCEFCARGDLQEG